MLDQSFTAYHFNEIFQIERRSDINLERGLQAYYSAQPAVCLSNKVDLVEVVNNALLSLGIAETVDEGIAYTLVNHSGIGKMYPQWEAMVRFVEQ